MKQLALKLMSMMVFTSVFTSHISASIDTHRYTEVVDFSMLSTSNSSHLKKETSLAQCAVECSSNIDCVFIQWDPFGGSCVISSDIIIHSGVGTSNTPDTTRLYTQCPYDSGYELWSYGSSTKCLFLSSETTNYETARDKCNNREGRLYRSSSLELVDLLFNFARERHKINHLDAYIGLNDIQNEGSFVWSDGKAMTSAQRSGLFNYPQPDDGFIFGNEDCVAVSAGYYPHNDEDCGVRHRFACEF